MTKKKPNLLMPALLSLGLGPLFFGPSSPSSPLLTLLSLYLHAETSPSDFTPQESNSILIYQKHSCWLGCSGQTGARPSLPASPSAHSKAPPPVTVSERPRRWPAPPRPVAGDRTGARRQGVMSWPSYLYTAISPIHEPVYQQSWIATA